MVHACISLAAMIGQAPVTGVVCADAGAGGYQAFPDVVRLASGDILCVFYAGYGHISFPREDLPNGARVCQVRSTDNGQTWGPPTAVADTPWDDRDPSIAELPDGSLICNWFTYTAGQEKHRVGNIANYKEIYVARSRDDGRTWSEPELVDSAACDYYGCSSPVRVLASGALIMPIYRELTDPLRCWSYVIISEDNGQTWGKPISIDPANDDNDEPDIVELPGGRLLCVMRTNHVDSSRMWRSESTDGGRTWSKSEPMPFIGHAPYLLRTASGVLICGHRLPGTSFHYSLDEGITWSANILVDEHIGAYTSMCELPDGRVLFVYYEEGEGSAIRSALLDVRGGRVDVIGGRHLESRVNAG